MIPYGKQDIRPEDIDAVARVLQSDFLTQGPMVPEFEQAFCRYTGANYSVAVNSATSALHIACLALDLSPDDYLWTSPISFVASANCALYCGARVDFVDIDPATFNLCPNALEAKLELAERENRLPKIVVPVHMGGLSCDMKAIKALSDRYGFSIIEDASHAVGGSYLGDKIGGCRFSDITVFSFHPVKVITAGEGGLALTQNEELAARMRSLRCHGITRSEADMTEMSHGHWYYQQQALGYNFRLSDIHAALGLSQLVRLDDYIQGRRDFMAYYKSQFSNTPIAFQGQTAGAQSSFHLCLIQLPDNVNRAETFDTMRKKGVGVNVHYIPIHLQPWYQSMGFNAGQFPKSESYYCKALTLPLYPDLTEADVGFITDTLRLAM